MASSLIQFQAPQHPGQLKSMQLALSMMALQVGREPDLAEEAAYELAMSVSSPEAMMSAWGDALMAFADVIGQTGINPVLVLRDIAAACASAIEDDAVCTCREDHR